MNVCFVCNEYPEGPHGGIGTMTQLLAEELSRDNHKVKVIGIYDYSYPSPDFEIKKGVEITRLRSNYKNNLSVFRAYWKLGNTIRNWSKNNQIDIIESPDSYGMLSLFPGFGKPLVLRAHGNNTYFSSILNIPVKKKTLFYERNLYRKASGYSAVSQFTANKMSSLLNIRNPYTIIYNGIEIPQAFTKDETFTENCKKILTLQNPIIFSGTLTAKKGIYELVRAAVKLLEQGIILTLIMNGKDSVNLPTGKSVKEELLTLIPASLRGRFIFSGHITRNELICQYKYSKAAIFPSYAEAFALAPMEAMATGIPTIFSNTCSGAELISDKVDGFLIDPRSEDSMAQAIKYILDHPLESKIIGEKGREKILNNFSKEIMATKTLKFYDHVQASNKR